MTTGGGSQGVTLIDEAVDDATGSDIASRMIDAAVRVPFTENSRLAEVGLDSLTLVSMAVACAPDTDQEIDAGALAQLRTVGELRQWLRALAGGGEPG